ncbi:ABC transporter permease [Nocardiopsis exhalans]|uniref:ABC transporter permease n=1 Tax=Nocardiopsis exhalans TaxID=163604 RepID=A0ABY5D4U9_9ACTN|nr:ABC transporter permease [Nocardiopsis exhalans]USY18415.1 ABC transporter permease [Nocardiopsis exhalans]
MERTLEEQFVLTARARGTGPTAVRTRHVLRHTLVPLLSLSGWVLGSLLAGSVIVEAVFNRPGLGRLLVNAIAMRDFPVITGVIVVSAIAVTLITLLVDLLYRVVDPRLREVRP